MPTTLLFTALIPHPMQPRLNEDLQRLIQWFCTNKLSINVSKCKFMLLGHSSRYGDFSSLSLSLSGEDLERVDCYKYLGITLNQRLSWEDHVSNIAFKIRNRKSFLSRIKYMLPISVRLTFYNTTIKPFLNTIVLRGRQKKYSSHGHSSNTSKQSCEDNPWQRLKRFCYTSFERSQLVNFSQKENYRPMYFC